MAIDHVLPPCAPGRLEQASTRIAFFIAGFGVAAWAPLVPFAKARAGLTDGTLGALLLCMGAGSVVAMPAAGALAMRFGCRKILLAAAGSLCLILPALATAAGRPSLVLALFAFGAAIGSVDCVMNIQAAIVERASRTPMMSGFHGLFSLGGIVGAGGVSALLGAGASPLAAALCVVAAIILAMVKAAPHCLRYGAAAEGPAFAVPRGLVLFIGLLCLVMFLTEGSVLDWSAVFLTSLRAAPPGDAGLGYAAFATTMTMGRLCGDAAVRRVGGTRIIVLGSLCAACGLAVAVLLPVWWVDVAGYALVGLGCSNIVPVLYTAVGRQTAMPEHLAVPAITSLGYLGILAGPAAIGFAARMTSLPVSFAFVACLLLGVAAAGRVVRA